MEEQYFNDELSYDVWKSKYQHNNETLDEFFIRIATEFARLDNFDQNILKNFSQEEIEQLSEYGQKRILFNRFEHFLSLFKNFKHIIPGGSVLSGVGSNKPVSLSNCFVLDTKDSIESIFESAHDMSEIYKRRGGVGIDLSPLRPCGAGVNNAAKTTGGVVPFMELFSQVTNTIGQAGRRGALMISIDINHPDSPEFITAKQDLTKITGANVSVRLNEEFMTAVGNNEDYLLVWPVNENYNEFLEEIPYNELVEVAGIKHPETKAYIRKIKAKELWESIIHCAWSTAEPGILFWNNIINNDPASVYPQFKAVSTNPCGRVLPQVKHF